MPPPPTWGSPPGAVGRGELRLRHKARAGPVSPQLPTFIAKVLHTICFIWATSEHYNTPSRIIVILQEFCNEIIEMVPSPSPWPPHRHHRILSPLPPGCPPAHTPRPFKSRQRYWHRDFQAWTKLGPSWWPPRVLPRPGQWQPNLPHVGREAEGKGATPHVPAPQDSARGFVGFIWSSAEPPLVSLNTDSLSFLLTSTHLLAPLQDGRALEPGIDQRQEATGPTHLQGRTEDQPILFQLHADLKQRCHTLLKQVITGVNASPLAEPFSMPRCSLWAPANV